MPSSASTLRIYNSLTREKAAFVPIEPGKVSMYVCGMTVYDYCHAGHARSMVAFDVVQRWLRAKGYQLTYVRNITDIDDKIIKRAVENGETISQLTERFIKALHEDADAMGIERPDHEPRATQYVPQMLHIIETLKAKDLAYQVHDGDNHDVYLSVRKFPGYGKLSGKTLDELRSGERVAVETVKQDPLDAVLWKSAKADEPADVKWPSGYGLGRPGWHIECSAMAQTLLGSTIDIHGGGADLQHPHHENEIAQSEGANGHTFVRTWMHNGFVVINEEKMSKSLGNFFTIRDVLKHFDAEAVRMFNLRGHYRSQLNYSDANLDDARKSLLSLYNALGDSAIPTTPVDWAQGFAKRFEEAMDDDFNTPVALAVLFEIANEANKAQGDARLALQIQLKALARVLGLLQKDPAAARKSGLLGSDAVANAGGEDEAINQLVEERTAAKKAKDFAKADSLRKQLAEKGIVLEDSAKGTTWRRA